MINDQPPLIDQIDDRILGVIGSSSRNPSNTFSFTAHTSNKLILASLAPSPPATLKKKKHVILKEGILNTYPLTERSSPWLEPELETPIDEEEYEPSFDMHVVRTAAERHQNDEEISTPSKKCARETEVTLPLNSDHNGR